MKRCPTCERTFEDSFTFCLIDGSVLSAPFDLKAIQSLPEPRQTVPPPTEVLQPQRETKQAPPPTVPAGQPLREELAPITAAPLASKPSPLVSSPAQRAKKSARPLLITISIGALLAIGLAILIFSARPEVANGNAANTNVAAVNVSAGVASNSNGSRTEVTPDPSPSPTPVINLAGTAWRSVSVSTIFVFRGDGTFLEKDDGRICRWSQTGDNFSVQCPSNKNYLSDKKSGVIKNNNRIEGSIRGSDGSSQTYVWLRVEQ